ncbi:reverse transcriptase domain-containing protein [Tanacetum coccineum]
MGNLPSQSYKRKKTYSPSLAFIKENIDVLRTMIKEHEQQAKIKATPRKLAYADFDKEALALSPAKGFFDRFSLKSSGTRSRRLEDQSMTKEKVIKKRSKPERKRSGHHSNSKYEEGSKDDYEDLNSPYKRPKPTPFTQRISRFKYHRKAKLPWNIRIYEGNKDPEDHLGIFSAATEKKEWSMPIWCKMFHQTLGGAAQNWFDDLDPKSVDSFEKLSQKFWKNFHNKKDMQKTRLKFTAPRGGRMKACKLSWSGSSPKVHT